MVELAYTTDLKSVAQYGLAGSSPASATINGEIVKYFLVLVIILISGCRVPYPSVGVGAPKWKQKCVTEYQCYSKNLAQRLEPPAHNGVVLGSNPRGPTKHKRR